MKKRNGKGRGDGQWIEPRKLALSSHQDTSHEAAEHIAGSPEAVAKLKKQIIDLVAAHPKLTAKELARVSNDPWAKKDSRRFGRRLFELAEPEDGRVSRTGPRRCTETGRRAETWGIGDKQSKPQESGGQQLKSYALF